MESIDGFYQLIYAFLVGLIIPVAIGLIYHFNHIIHGVY